MTKFYSRIGAAALLVLAFAGVGVAGAHPDSAAPHHGFGKYQDVDRALAAGYVSAGPCVPGMGYHYVRFDLVDDETSVSAPEALVFADGENGLQLVAVEYVATEPFELLGAHSHTGPVGPAIHAWFFLQNPDGLTADFNPRVNADCTVN